MRIITFCLLLICFACPYAYGQDITIFVPDDTNRGTLHIAFYIADMDGDGVADSIYYKSDSVVLALSSRNFEPFAVEYIRETAAGTTVTALDGGFELSHLETRTRTVERYAYEKETARFRLVFYGFERFANAPDGGIGTMSLDLKEEKFNAGWVFYPTETDSTEFGFDIDMNVTNSPIYFGDFVGLNMPQEDFITSYRNQYADPATDTVEFVRFSNYYDYLEMIYSQRGEEHWGMVYGDTGDINRGDIISITSQSLCLQPAGDPTAFSVDYMITNVEKIRNGRLSDFYATNKKPIQYAGDWEDQTERVSDVDYFLAHTTDKKIMKSLERKNSTLHIRAIHKGSTEEMSEGDCVLFEMYDQGDLVCEFAIEFIRDQNPIYHMLDEKTGEFRRIELK